jgi:hypothetical protein
MLGVPTGGVLPRTRLIAEFFRLLLTRAHVRTTQNLNLDLFGAHGF